MAGTSPTLIIYVNIVLGPLLAMFAAYVFEHEANVRLLIMQSVISIVVGAAATSMLASVFADSNSIGGFIAQLARSLSTLMAGYGAGTGLYLIILIARFMRIQAARDDVPRSKDVQHGNP